VAEEFQIGFGYARVLALHVPLGVAIFGLTVALLVGTGRLTRADAALKERPRTPART
jgi:mannose/fructose/N-acetylgalactosamine-specific phosphotransferase system component IIC